MTEPSAELVGLVVVSHSRPLARAAVELALQMSQGAPVRVAIAAGLEEDVAGTDAVAISEAIGEVAGAAGAVVLMDLGSALLSAELALELLDDDVRDRVTLSPAPLVEGLVGAVVAAAGGASRSEVAAEAANGLAGKASQLAPTSPAAEREPAPEPSVRGRFRVTDPQGLHARPAASLVTALRELGVPVTLRNLTTGAGPVPGASLSRVATLGALVGHEIEVSAVGGPELQPALDEILAAAGAPASAAPAAGAVAAGPPSAGAPARDVERGAELSPPVDLPGGPLAASPGIAVGPVLKLTEPGTGLAESGTGLAESGTGPAEPGMGRAGSGTGPAGPVAGLAEPVLGLAASGGGRVGAVSGTGRATGPPAAERARLDAAVAAVRAELTTVRDRVADELGVAEADIFRAHLLLLDDPELQDGIAAALAEGASAEEAFARTMRRAEEEWAALPDPYLRARAADLAALRDQVLGALGGPAGLVADGGGVFSGGVLVAGDLTPAQAVTLDADRTLGVVLAYGSPTAHSAILLRARGVPALVAAGPAVLELAPGTVLALDGGTGELVVDPDDGTRKRFLARREAAREAADRARSAAAGPAVTTDGVPIAVGANLGGPADAWAAAAAGAELAGLVRTEFLFLGRSTAPDEDEQVASYRELAQALGGRRLTLRTLDVGGDKPLPYLPVPAGANPFLGVRGLRLSLVRPELFAVQLRAIVRVAHETPVTALFPMVSTVEELRAARTALAAAIRAVGRGEPAGLRVGAMIEVPAAALKAAALAPLVDEFSIGTNDLTQYTLAAARGDGAVAALGDPWDPGVLQLVDAVCRVGLPVAVCGEFAADPGAAALLLGLGVRELSVTPGAVAATKEAVRAVDTRIAKVLAREALARPGPADVRALFTSSP